MILLKKLLVATDFSAPSAAALAYGRELAFTFGAQLVVAHVVERVLTNACGGGDGFMFVDPDLQHTVEAAARAELETLISEEDGVELRARVVVLTSGSPADAIVEYAKAAGIDLVVMGTHGRGALTHLLMGSVAERVVRLAPCPVLTVRHPEREFVLPDALMAMAATASH